MAEFPNPETQFKPGQSGNPRGYSRKRRVADALADLIDRSPGRAAELALIVFAKASGQEEALQGRKPDLAWFRELRSMLGEGETNAAPQPDDDEPKRIIVPDVDERLAPRES